MAYINVTKPENYMPISIPYEYDVMEKYEHIGKCLITYEYIISFHNLHKYIYIYIYVKTLQLQRISALQQVMLSFVLKTTTSKH